MANMAGRLAALESDNAALRAAVEEAISLVRTDVTRGRIIPNWRAALARLMHWVRPEPAQAAAAARQLSR